ncbi:helix-turn-helix domain-containing protein [Nocardia sp. NPDC020380]|uniref:helix-turn-helix domain-containing protein n=1 Tax=Nocardia sp. NPDC020380 TaxID=3364309 RepID=UPI0037B07506
MSVEAMAWALIGAPDVGGREQVVLIGLANHAHADGTFSYPSHATLAAYARCDKRTVRRAIASLETKGLIERGDQRAVDHLPPDRRPIVWNLLLDRKIDRGGVGIRPGDGDRPDVRVQAGGRSSPTGGISATERGDADVPQTVLNRPGTVQKPSVPARSGSLPTEGWKLVRGIVGDDYPQAVRTGLARMAGELLASGTDLTDVAAALRTWLTKPTAGIGLLPHLVADAIKARTAPRPLSTTDQRVWQAQALKRPEWDDHDPAFDPPAVGLAARFDAQKAITR